MCAVGNSSSTVGFEFSVRFFSKLREFLLNYFHVAEFGRMK